MIFIENKFDFLQFLDEYQKHTNKIYVRLSDDDKHVMNNRISFVYIQTPFDEFIINVNNGDGLGIKKEALQKLLDTQKVQLVFNYKAISQILQFKKALDIDMMKFIEYGYSDIEFDSNRNLQFYKSKFKNELNLNDSIPIMKQIELIQNYSKKFPIKFDVHKLLYPLDSVRAFSYIEQSGLKIDSNYNLMFNTKNLTKDNFVFTEYNLMTSTLRPSNRHGNVNFAALKKDNGERKSIISRFEDGELISCDFESYHPRLLMDLIYKGYLNSSTQTKDYQWITDFYAYKNDFYTWIGKQMGLSDRDEIKTAVFRNLYGGISKDLLHIPYFKEIQVLTEVHYEKLQKDGAIHTYEYKVRIDKERLEPITPAKVLNYLIQSYETERNITIINKIKDKLEGKQSKLILYTYDAFVFDVCKDEKQYLYTEVFPLMVGANQRYPIKITVGKNYDEL
jgi:hypothetical protein